MGNASINAGAHFLTINAHIGWRRKSQPYLTALYADDCHRDIRTDADHFAHAASQDQHLLTISHLARHLELPRHNRRVNLIRSHADSLTPNAPIVPTNGAQFRIRTVAMAVPQQKCDAGENDG
jgi:hypothetical protein